jgi:hypothetical protein
MWLRNSSGRIRTHELRGSIAVDSYRTVGF